MSVARRVLATLMSDFNLTGSGGVLLAPDLNHPRVWLAVGSILQRQELGNQHAPLHIEFPFVIEHLKTTKSHVFVVGGGNVHVLNFDGVTQNTLEYPATVISTNSTALAILTKSDFGLNDKKRSLSCVHIFRNPLSDYPDRMWLDREAFQIALSDKPPESWAYGLFALPSQNAIEIYKWNCRPSSGSEIGNGIGLFQTISLEHPVDQIFFPPEWDFTWIASLNKESRTLRLHYINPYASSEKEPVAAISADFCSSSPNIFSCFQRCDGLEKMTKVILGVWGAWHEEAGPIKGHFTDSVIVSQRFLVILTEERKIEIYELKNSPGECTLL